MAHAITNGVMYYTVVGAARRCTDTTSFHQIQRLTLLQVLRADLIAQDPLGLLNLQDPRRSLLKPEMVWQYEKGFQQTPAQVRNSSFVKCAHWLHDRAG